MFGLNRLFWLMSSDGVEIRAGLRLGRCECGSEVEVAAFGNEHNLQLTAGVCLSDKPMGRWIGGVLFAVVNEVRPVVVQKTRLNFIARDEMPRGELSQNHWEG